MYGPPGGPYPDRRDDERAPRGRRAWADAVTRDALQHRDPSDRHGSPPDDGRDLRRPTGGSGATSGAGIDGSARPGFRPAESPSGYDAGHDRGRSRETPGRSDRAAGHRAGDAPGRRGDRLSGLGLSNGPAGYRPAEPHGYVPGEPAGYGPARPGSGDRHPAAPGPADARSPGEPFSGRERSPARLPHRANDRTAPDRTAPPRTAPDRTGARPEGSDIPGHGYADRPDFSGPRRDHGPTDRPDLSDTPRTGTRHGARPDANRSPRHDRSAEGNGSGNRAGYGSPHTNVTDARAENGPGARSGARAENDSRADARARTETRPRAERSPHTQGQLRADTTLRPRGELHPDPRHQSNARHDNGSIRHEPNDPPPDNGIDGGSRYDGNWPGWADGLTWQDESRTRGPAKPREYDPGRPGGHAVRDVEDGSELYRAGYDYPEWEEDPRFHDPGFGDPQYGPAFGPGAEPPVPPGEVWAPARDPDGSGGHATRWIVGVLCVLVLVAGGGLAYYLISRDGAAGAGTAGPSPAGDAPSAQVSARASAPAPSPAASRSSAPGPAEDARTAKVGDCLVNRGTESKPEMRRVTCAPSTYQVLKRIDGTSDKSKCDGTPSLTDWYFYDHPDDTRDFVLCLKKRS
jgi:hypothetical protein